MKNMPTTQTELFQVSAFDPPLRDQRDVMEFPFLSIQKGRRKPISFKNKGGSVELEVSSSSDSGLATIWDWDLIIYAAANLNDAIESGLKTSPRITFAPYDALRYAKRSTGGQNYKDLAAAMLRLYSTSVETTIRNEEGGFGAFRWVSGIWIPMQYRKKVVSARELRFLKNEKPDPTRPWMIELTPWLYESIIRQKEILAMHPDYFQLTGGLERWLYRLCRKAVPEKADFPAINFRMETLHKRSGSTRPLRMFAYDMRKIQERNALPEYSVVINKDKKHELVTLIRNQGKLARSPRGVRLAMIEGKAH